MGEGDVDASAKGELGLSGKGDATFLSREGETISSSECGRGGCAARSDLCASRPSAETLATRQECRVSSEGGGSVLGTRQECRVSSAAQDLAGAPKGDATFLSRATKKTPTTIPRPRFFDPSVAVRMSRGGNLPHWEQPGCACFVTWRTADSLPKDKLDALQEERAAWLRAHAGDWSETERAEYARLFEGRVQTWLDAGYGACTLRDAKIRKSVEDVILRFDGDRVFVYALVVMPNHVHVLFMPLGEQSVRDIVRTWKGVSARAVNQALGATGDFWQKESWDHLVRSERQFAKFVRYIRTNDPTIAYSVYGEGTEDE